MLPGQVAANMGFRRFSATLTLAGVLALAWSCHAADPPADVTFRASYAKGVNADSAAGDPAGRVVGTCGFTPGLSDQAVVVGPAGWLEYSLPANINQDDVPGSIAMWVKPLNWDGASTLGATLFSAAYDNRGKRESDQGLFRLYTQGNGRLTFIAGTYPKDDPRRQVWAQTGLSDWRQGEWHHVVVTWDGADVTIYLDGEQKARNPIRITTGGGEDPRFKPSLGTTFTVGGSPWGDTGETAVDEVTISRKALRPGEVAEAFRQRSALAGRPATTPEAEAAPPTSLPLPVATRQPVLDGTIAAGEWDDASAANSFVSLLVPEVKLWPYGNRLLCKVVGPNLYLGLVSEFYAGAAPVAEAASNSGQVFQDDCFEVFLTLGRGLSDQVHQIEVNSRGSLDAYRCKPRSVLAPTAIRAAAAVHEKSWTAELEVPLTEIAPDLKGAPPAKVLLQVSRSYKRGTLAERERQQRSLGQEPIEEYAGFPWNVAFLDQRHYAELVTSPEGRSFACSLDLAAFLGRKRFSVRGHAGPRSVSPPPLQITWPGLEPPLSEPVTFAPDRTFSTERDLPVGATEARLTARPDVHLSFPLTRNSALVLKHQILSYNNTMEVTVDLSGMGAPPAGMAIELRVLNAAGKAVTRKSLRPAGSTRLKETHSLQALPAGEYVLECAVPKAPAGVALGTERQAFQVFRGVPGQGRYDHLVEEVPTPWTPVEARPNGEIRVWGRTYSFGDSFLPRSIMAQGSPLLAAPAYYQLQVAGGTEFRMESGTSNVVERAPAHCTLLTAGAARQVAFRQRTTIEYDGMIRCDVEVTSPSPLSRLALVIPYLPERAQVFQPCYFRGKFSHVQMDPVEMKPGFEWTSEVLEPALFLSDMHAGLSWFAASDRTWVVDEGQEKLRVTRDGLVVNFVRTAQAGPRSLKFTFGLQAFPTKPPRADWREFGRVREAKWMSVFVPDTVVEKAVDGRVLPDYFTTILPELPWGRRLRGLLLPFCNFPRSVESYTALPPRERQQAVQQLHEALGQARAAGFEYVVPYLTPTYGTMSLPEWRFYWSNWMALPKHVFEAYGQPCASVANKQWTDFWLYSFEQYVRAYGLKGVFHDMALPYAEEGTLNGLGYDRNGVRYPEYPLWELRELYKKIYVLHRKLFPDAMSFMNYGTFTPPLHSFCDFVLCAERYETRADRSIYDLDGDGNISPFRYQSSLPFGPKAMHNGWLKYSRAMDEKEPTVHMYGMVLLHDLVQWNINENPAVRTGIHELKQQMGLGYDRDVEFLPYWDHRDKVRTDNGDLVVSMYRRGSRLMAVLVNTRTQQSYRGQVTLDLRKLGITDVQRVEVFDPLDASYTPLASRPSDGSLTVDVQVAPTLFKALVLNR